MSDFAGLGLSPEVIRAIDDLGFEEPSPVQQGVIPELLAGRDVIAQAMTGTGKTAAFGIPIAEALDPDVKAIQCLVLTPTRELAVQVSGEIYRLARFRGLQVVPIYGGQPYDRQIRALRAGAQIVVATPGRLLDLMRRGVVDLAAARIVVLDEADEMLAMGFLEDIRLVLDALPAERQVALFSATLPPPIRQLAARYLRDAAEVTLGQPRGQLVPAIEQRYYEVPGRYKFEALVRVLDVEQPALAIVFCGTKRAVDEVGDGLRARGYQAETLHGDMSQALRDRATRAAREGRIEVLAATDVAARGLDIEHVSHVVNYDLPQDPEYYIHRIGRTGRAGRSGTAITFVTPWEMREFRLIEQTVGARIRRAEIPTAAEVAERERELLAARVATMLRGGAWGRYRQVVEELANDHDPIDLAAAALALAEEGRAGAEGPAPVEERASPLEEWLSGPRRPAGRPKPARQQRPGRPAGPPRQSGRRRYEQRPRG